MADTTLIKGKKVSGPLYTIGEEIANAITHGIGAAAGIVGAVFLMIKASGDISALFPVALYSLSIIILFIMSTLYHSIQHAGAKSTLRVCDHSSVFLLIAGTYTPYTLIALRGAVGTILFAIVWSTAIFGTILNIINLERFKKIAMACYIASGWCIIFAIIPLLKALSSPALILMLLGGLFYTLGLFFYRQKNVKYRHTVWHVFVLAGAALQYFSIYIYVI